MNIPNSDPQAQFQAEIVARPINCAEAADLSRRRVPAVADLPRRSPLANTEALGEARSLFEQRASMVDHRLATIGGSQVPESADCAFGSLVRPSGRHVRKGKIARLPKLERDLVNRMLQNNIPYEKIVGALDDLGIRVTQRNISNWRTRGGYKDWCVEQEHQLRLSLMQDNLTDYLRKNDASQLPEVGLQVAATQLSSMLLQPEAVQHLTAEPEKYSKVVEMLCRLATHIQSLQKDRDESVKKAAIRGTSEQLKRADEKVVEEVRRSYTDKLGDNARDPNIPHRNELPKRDELPFREPPPKGPTMLEILQHMRKSGPSVPALPAPQPKPAENPATEKAPPLNG